MQPQVQQWGHFLRQLLRISSEKDQAQAMGTSFTWADVVLCRPVRPHCVLSALNSVFRSHKLQFGNCRPARQTTFCGFLLLQVHLKQDAQSTFPLTKKRQCSALVNGT